MTAVGSVLTYTPTGTTDTVNLSNKFVRATKNGINIDSPLFSFVVVAEPAPEQPGNFPSQIYIPDPPRVAALPNHACWGNDAWGGWGEHLSVPNGTVGFVDRLGPFNTGFLQTTGDYAGCYFGDPEYIGRLGRPLVAVHTCSGWMDRNIPAIGGSNPSFYVNWGGSYLTVLGYTAPIEGFYYVGACKPYLNGSDVQTWGLCSYPGDEYASGMNPNNRDAFSLDGPDGSPPKKQIHICKESGHGLDELDQVYLGGEEFGFLYNLWAETLQWTLHTDNDTGWPAGAQETHAMMMLFGGGGTNRVHRKLSICRSAKFHCGDRAPRTNAREVDHTENLDYNVAYLPQPPATTGFHPQFKSKPGTWQSSPDGQPQYWNEVANTHICGPNNDPNDKHQVVGVPGATPNANSKIHADLNCGFGGAWSYANQQAFVSATGMPASYYSSTIRPEAMPPGRKTDKSDMRRHFQNPLAPTQAEKLAMAELYKNSVGAGFNTWRRPVLFQQLQNYLTNTGDKGSCVSSSIGKGLGGNIWAGKNPTQLVGEGGCLPAVGVRPTIVSTTIAPNSPGLRWVEAPPPRNQWFQLIDATIKGVYFPRITKGRAWHLRNWVYLQRPM